MLTDTHLRCAQKALIVLAHQERQVGLFANVIPFDFAVFKNYLHHCHGERQVGARFYIQPLRSMDSTGIELG